MHVGLCAILAACCASVAHGSAGDIYISSLDSFMSDMSDEIVSATDLYDRLTEEDLNVRRWGTGIRSRGRSCG